MFSHFISVTLVSVIFLHSAFGIIYSEFCAVSDPICRGKYTPNGEYKTECTTVCDTKHSYRWSDTFCAKRNETCADAPRRKIALISSLKFVNYKAKIAKCQVKPYVWSLKDFCVNGSDCQEAQPIRMMGSRFYRKKMPCRCRGRLSYHCDGWACAVNSRACDALKLKSLNLKMTSSFDKKSIKSCCKDGLVFLVNNFKNLFKLHLIDFIFFFHSSLRFLDQKFLRKKLLKLSNLTDS